MSSQWVSLWAIEARWGKKLPGETDLQLSHLPACLCVTGTDPDLKVSVCHWQINLPLSGHLEIMQGNKMSDCRFSKNASGLVSSFKDTVKQIFLTHLCTPPELCLVNTWASFRRCTGTELQKLHVYWCIFVSVISHMCFQEMSFLIPSF